MSFFNPNTEDHNDNTSLDLSESEQAIVPDGEYTDRKISDLLSENGIHLRTIANLLSYVDEQCDFEYGAYRIFKHLFYDESG